MNKSIVKSALTGAIALAVTSPLPLSATALSNGTPVRIQAGSIEGGWHTGLMHRDELKCWMVKLDKPTRDNYTMLALIVVSELQVESNVGWTAVGLKPVLQDQPAVCREYGAD